MHHRYTLEPYHGRDSKIICPNCRHHRRTFKRYLDTATGQALAGHVGKCDRIDGCGYHYPPREYFRASPGAAPAFAPPVRAKRFDTLPRHYVDDTTRAYHRNNFVRFLTGLFGERLALIMAAKYQIGTSKHWPGATIFWQIDVKDKLRTGKIMLYNATDGHRVKQPFNHITWAHGLLRQGPETPSHLSPAPAAFNLQQCFFGEHLLPTDPFKTVAIAESEKTAVIASFFYPKYNWLACGSLEGLNIDKCHVLKDRNVILYPDVTGYDKWRQKAREIRLRYPGARVSVDDTLERVASEDDRVRGIDIADRWIEQWTKHL